MAAYIVFIRDRMRDKDEMDAYTKLAGPSLRGQPVKVLAAYGANETLEGSTSDGVVLMEFPSAAEAKAWYDSPAYTEARKHRFQGADYRVVLFEGLPPRTPAG